MSSRWEIMSYHRGFPKAWRNGAAPRYFVALHIYMAFILYCTVYTVTTCSIECMQCTMHTRGKLVGFLHFTIKFVRLLMWHNLSAMIGAWSGKLWESPWLIPLQNVRTSCNQTSYMHMSQLTIQYFHFNTNSHVSSGGCGALHLFTRIPLYFFFLRKTLNTYRIYLAS